MPTRHTVPTALLAMTRERPSAVRKPTMQHHPLRRTALAIAIGGCLALVPASPAHATFPGRNGLIAFSRATDHHVQIFTVRPNGRDLRQITHVSSGDAINADWSPDGRSIAFDIDTPDSAQIAIMNADGSGLFMLPQAPGDLFEGEPSFMPDGRRIVFGTFNGEVESLWSSKLDGTDRRLIKAGSAVDPNVSPDARRVAFMDFNGQPFGQALFTIAINGSKPLQLTPFSYNLGFRLDWAPDGRELAFIHNVDLADPNRSVNIATIHPDGTGLRFLTDYRDPQVRALIGSYSPDGRWIVFRYEDHGRFGLYKMHPDGTHMRPILGLSASSPRLIDWGTSTHPGDDDEDDRQDASNSD
jgi:Tol biopolymer transport system component